MITNDTSYNLNKIENDARRMRAEALKFGVKRGVAWVRSVVTHRGQGAKQAV